MGEHRRLGLFGATGGTGVHLIPLLLERGFRVRAVARHPSSLTLRHEHLEVVEGDVLDPGPTARAIAGCDAVISLTGPRRLEPTTVYSEGGRNLVAGMRAAGVRRLVAVTALGTSKDFRMPPVLGFLARNVVGWFLRHGWRDGAKFETELAREDLDWTVLRPPALNHQPPRGGYRRAIAEHLRSPFRLSRADLARAVLDQLDDPATFRKWVEVAW
jgi:putative NADH-flavin reductase